MIQLSMQFLGLWYHLFVTAAFLSFLSALAGYGPGYLSRYPSHSEVDVHNVTDAVLISRNSELNHLVIIINLEKPPVQPPLPKRHKECESCKSSMMARRLVIFIREDLFTTLTASHLHVWSVSGMSNPNRDELTRSFFFFLSSEEVNFLAFLLPSILLPMASNFSSSSSPLSVSRGPVPCP